MYEIIIIPLVCQEGSMVGSQECSLGGLNIKSSIVFRESGTLKPLTHPSKKLLQS